VSCAPGNRLAQTRDRPDVRKPRQLLWQKHVTTDSTNDGYIKRILSNFDSLTDNISHCLNVVLVRRNSVPRSFFFVAADAYTMQSFCEFSVWIQLHMLSSVPLECWSTAPHAVVLTLMREHYYCVYLYNAVSDACCWFTQNSFPLVGSESMMFRRWYKLCLATPLIS